MTDSENFEVNSVPRTLYDILKESIEQMKAHERGEIDIPVHYASVDYSEEDGEFVFETWEVSDDEETPFVLVNCGKIEDLTEEDLAGFDFSTE